MNIISKIKRIDWLDAIKGLAIISVVFGHALRGYVENNAFPDVNTVMREIMDWIYTWHMPLFFLVSGVSFYLSCLKTGINKEKIKKQTVNLLLLYLIFVVALCLLKTVFSAFVDNKIGLSQILINILLPGTVMWYLWVLVIYYLAFTFIESCIIKSSVNHDKIRLTVFAILTVISYCGSVINKSQEIRLCMKNLICYAAFFYLGVMLARYIGTSMKKSWIIVATYVISMTYIVFYFLSGEKYGVLPDMVTALLETLNAFAICLMCLDSFSRICSLGKNGLLVRLGKQSLVIYLLHTYLVTALKVVFVRLGIGNWVIALIITTVIPLIITYFIAIMVPKIPLARYIFRPIDLFKKTDRR